MVIHNSIFDSYRIEQKNKIRTAIKLLKEEGVIVNDNKGGLKLNNNKID
tara:strand:- start:34 stop:180 length:147 start_codon:yes stop_codon:yes gene_type:complete